MRYDVKKFLFIGLNSDKELFFEKAQELGIIHFLETKAKIKETGKDIQNLLEANKILRGLPPLAQEELEEMALADGLAERIIELKHTLDKLAEDERVTNLEKARVEIFGDFSFDEIAKLEKETGRKFQFFFSKHGAYTDETLPGGVYLCGE